MAEILPFRALHYNTLAASAGLDRLVTQPYDKITPEMQSRYYAASPYNLARIIRRRPEPAERDPYAAAAAEFRSWIERGVLARDGTPALYPYDQRYTVPGAPNHTKLRRGVVALCRLEDYSKGIVHRHEQTLSGPKADRLALLAATRAHFGQIFMLYSDPEGAIERELESVSGREGPWENVEDEYGTAHRVWRLDEEAQVARIQAAMKDKKLVIADGHHRYETALAYRDQLRASGRDEPASEYVLATFVRMESDGVLILPTHRLVHGLAEFDWRRFLAAAGGYFEVQERQLSNAPDAIARLLAELAEAGRGANAFVAYAGGGGAAILTLRPDAASTLFADAPPGLAKLDVFVLHRLIVERLLGVDPESVREERNLQYEREATSAVRTVDTGEAQVCILLNPTPIDAVRDNAFGGQPMPQKSTDFYPKLLSGLTTYDLDQP